MNETFIINNIQLKVNPQDITVSQFRHLNSAQFIRDEASYTSKSITPRTSYNVIISFDINDFNSLTDLVMLITQIDMYPFVFIESKRLRDYVGNSYGSNSYQIFGTSEYTIEQSVAYEGLIVLSLTLLNFNYLPFCRGFDFFNPEERMKKDRSLLMQVKTGVSTESVHLGVTTPFESKMFNAYFGAEIRRRLNSVSEFGDKDKPLSYFAIKFPTFTPVKPEKDSDFIKMSITSPAGISNIDYKGSSAADKSDAMDVWVKWNNLIVGGEKNINVGGGIVSSISITKSNNFVEHSLSGWTLPVLQYMGKGPSRQRVSFCKNSDGEYGDGSGATTSFIKYITTQMDVNYIKNRAYDAYNVIKTESLLGSLIPAFGFALEAESINAVADEQGKEFYSYSLIESDTRNLLDRSRYTNSGTKDPDIQISIMANVLKSIINEFVKTPEYQNAEDNESTLYFNLTNIGATGIATNKDSAELYDALLVLNKRLVAKEKTILKKEFDDRFPFEKSKREFSKPDKFVPNARSERIGAFSRSLNQIHDYEITNISRLLEERISPTGRFKGDELLKIDRDVEATFYKIIRFADQGNRYCSSASRYADLIKNNYNSIVDDFSGEAIEDLKIGSILGVNAGALREYGFEDPRDMPPFFFLKQKRYLNADIIRTSLDVSDSSEEKMIELINKIIKNSTGTEDNLLLKDRAIQQKDFEQELIKLSSGLQNGGQEALPEDDDSPQSNIFKSGILGENIDPFGKKELYLYHAKRMAYTFDHGINLAFPTVKIYLVEGDEASIANNLSTRKHNYYELKGIIELGIVTNSDENPVDVLSLLIANPGSVYTDDHVAFEANRIRSSPGLLDTSGENRFHLNRLRIRPGNRLHIKAGYGNNPNELETIFNGVITDVGGESALSVVAEGFGRELISYEHGDDPTEDNFFLSADTSSIIANALYSNEIEHFGTLKFHIPGSGKYDEEAKSLGGASPFGLFAYSLKTRLFTNIYIDSIIDDQLSFDFSSGFLNPFSGAQLFYDFPMYKSTPWSMLKEMEYRHPGTLSKPVLYGDRHSYFFGIKEQLYIYRDLASEIMKESSSLFNLFGPQNKNTLYNKLRSLRFKPVCDFHILSSDHNIIKNSLRVTDEFNTVLNIQYYGDQSDLEDGDIDFYEMKVDDNITPSEHRRGELAMLGCHGELMAYKYGSVGLRRELEKMYDGTITVIGNPYIKAGDYAGLYDDHRALKGIIKVRECSHQFSLDQGYITVITPGLYAESSHVDYSQLFSNLFIAAGSVVDYVKIRAQLDSQDDIFLRSSITQSILNDVIDGGQPDHSEGEFKGALVSTGSTAVIGAGAIRSLSFLKSTNTGKKIIDAGKIAQTVGELGATSLRLGASAISTAANSKAAALGPTAVKWLGDITATSLRVGAEVSKFGGIAAKLGMAASTMGGPVVWVATLLMGVFTAKFEEISLTRQPVRIFPLQLNGKPYLGGINGFKNNGYFESVAEEISKTWHDAVELSDYMSARLDAGI